VVAFLDRLGTRFFPAVTRRPWPLIPFSLLCLLLTLMPGLSNQQPPPPERLPPLDDEQVWTCLPEAVRGEKQHLPGWARTLAGPLPHTTAMMLELDYLHRARSPLDARLRGQLRWVAAHANHCRYSEAYAAADLRRAGMDDASIQALGGDARALPATLQPALAFARKLTLAASTITDGEVARLIQQYGEKQVMAVVLLVAHANFQDRLILALDVQLGPNEPLPPLELRFRRPRAGCAVTTLGRRLELGAGFTPPDKSTKQPNGDSKPEREPTPRAADDAEWASLDYNGIQRELDRQRARRCRIKLPPDNAGARWGLVCQAYQPELASAWGACARAFGAEAEQDPLLEASVFWVVTRSLRCFY
jgi:alkylhydroperoxidase family enzyme